MNVREWALPVYTILMQLAAGSIFVLWCLRSYLRKRYDRKTVDSITRNPLMVIFASVMIGVIASHFHLSKPFFSFLSILNLANSWLSREVVLTVVFLISLGWLAFIQEDYKVREKFIIFLGWFSTVIGIGTVLCMAMLYLLPTQEAWNSPFTIVHYGLTAFLLGVITIAALLVLELKISHNLEEKDIEARNQIISAVLPWFTLAVLTITVFSLILDWQAVSVLKEGSAAAQTSLALLFGLYLPLFLLRYVFLFSGGMLFAISAVIVSKRFKAPGDLLMPVYLACLLVLIAEILERFLFYATHVRVGI
jgi:anaerobic dimethyl sulfoxide reductase subunit C